MRDSQEESVAGLQKGDDDSDPIAGSFAQAFNQLGDGLHDTGQLAVDGTAIAVQATGKFVGGLLDGDAFFPDNESRLARATELAVDISASRSEERRVGKECVQPCRSRWSPYH